MSRWQFFFFCALFEDILSHVTEGDSVPWHKVMVVVCLLVAGFSYYTDRTEKSDD